jgi:hypothetical protein
MGLFRKSGILHQQNTIAKPSRAAHFVLLIPDT